MSQITIKEKGPVTVSITPLNEIVITKDGDTWRVVRKGFKEDHLGNWEVSALHAYLYPVPGYLVETNVSSVPKRVWTSLEDFVNALRNSFPNVKITQL